MSHILEGPDERAEHDQVPEAWARSTAILRA
jgi:hypothetical protein